MGILRTLLALLVVAAHISSFDNSAEIGWSGGAIMSVNLFFLLSGFYMALILDSKYKGRTRLFYANRALRLLPIYWITVLVTLIVMIGMHWYHIPWSLGYVLDSYFQLAHNQLAWWIIPIAIIANIIFFGLDLATITCVGFSSGAVHFYDNQPCQTLGYLSVVPPAWSLGIEVLFYLFIPIILRFGKKGILITMAAALLVRGALFIYGANVAPWNRSLFGTTLIFFMLGVVSFKLYKRIAPIIPASRLLWLALAIAAFSVLSYTYYYPRLSSQPVMMEALTVFMEPVIFLFFVFLVPFLFLVSKHSQIDKIIGELSYPIYITHYLTLALSSYFVNKTGILKTGFLGIDVSYIRFAFYITIVVLISGMGVLLVTHPVELVRRKIAAIALTT